MIAGNEIGSTHLNDDDDRRTASLPPIGSSGLAFTIDFDDCNNNVNNAGTVGQGTNGVSNGSRKKRLDIRDSIRKFAPPKPQTIERPRPPPAKNAAASTGPIITAATTTNSSKNNKSVDTREQVDKHQSSGQSSTPTCVGVSGTICRSQTKTIQSNSIRKTVPPTITADTSHLSDGACFLIQRMLFSEQQRQQTTPSLHSPPAPPPSSSSLVNTSRIASPPSKCSSLHLQPIRSGSKSSSSFRSRGELDSGVCDDHRSNGQEEDEELEEEEEDEEEEDEVVDEEEDDRQSNKGREEDELSETGTYTVEMDKCDPVEEEARKRIAEIFGSNGVATNGAGGEHYSGSSSSSSSSSAASGSRKNSFPLNSVDALQRILSRPATGNNSVAGRRSFDAGPTNRNSSSLNNSIGGSPLPERRSLPSGQQTPLASTEKLNELSQRFRNGTRLPNATGKKTTTTFANIKSTTSSFSANAKSATTFVARNNIPRLASSKAQPSPGVSSPRSIVSARISVAANQSANRTSGIATSALRHGGRNATRVGLAEREDSLSLRSEEASSGGSTDLSSIGSERCKSDLGTSSMRYNRTFALRRAHLGLPVESAGQPSLSHNKTSGRKTPTNISSSHTATTNTTRQQFDRADGGRFSLRLAKGNSKPTAFSIATCSNVPANNRRPPTHPPHPASSISSHGRITPVDQSNQSPRRNANFPSISSVNYQHVRARSFGGIEQQRNNLSPSLLGSKTLDREDSPSVVGHSSSLLPAPGTLSNIPTDSQVRSLQMLSPFQLSRRLFSTKSHYMATSGSMRSRNDETSTLISEPAFGNNNLFSAANHSGIRNHSFSLTASCNSPSMTASFTETRSTSGLAYGNGGGGDSARSKCLSSLDYLVLSAVHQLSFKLRCKLRTILENEKSKYPLDNENRILIEELLPQVNVSEFRGSESSEKTISRDLSNVLKNLKRIEQSLEGKTFFLAFDQKTFFFLIAFKILISVQF